VRNGKSTENGPQGRMTNGPTKNVGNDGTPTGRNGK
jgi:hypothetical protein